MKVVESLCKKGKKENEDVISYGDAYAFVLDGASELSNNVITKTSDANWYVGKVADYLIENMAEENLKLVVKKAIIAIRDDLAEYNKKIKFKFEIPSACLAFVREKESCFEFLVIGDCSIIYGNKKDQKLLTTRSLRKLDNEKITKMKMLADKKHINISETYAYVLPDLKKQRSSKNKPNGYYILDVEENVVNHANYKVVEKKDIDMIILMSDGFSSYYEILDLEKNYKKFFLKNYDYSIEELYDELRSREKKDRDLNNYPRFKVSDDASIIKIKVK